MNTMSKTIIAIASLVLMLGSTASLAGTANAQYEQSSQAAKSKTPGAAANKNADQQQKKAQAATKSKKWKEGDLYVTYHATDNTLSFNYMSIKSSKYDDYVKQLSKYKAPDLKQPEALPEGYIYQSSEIIPPFPEFLSEPYRKMLEEMKEEAKENANYEKKLVWSEAGESALNFTNGSDIIRISAYKMQPLLIEKTPAAGKGETLEKLTINEIEALYRTGSKAVYSTTLQWEDNKVKYAISINKDSTLTREELVTIAENMMKK